jgi:hypothetical protein
MTTLLLCVVASAALAAGSQRPDKGSRDAALRLFSQRVEAYAALHRSLEGTLPPLTSTREVVKNYAARQLLANAIRKARRSATQGDIFSPDVASVFRAIIGTALKGRDVERLLAELNEEHPKMHGVQPVVNHPLPKGTTHAMPSVLLQVLPALPEDVEYRIVNHDLVLWDIHANLVVDFIPNALRPVETMVLR